MSDLLDKYDAWLTDGGPAALVIREHLESVEGAGATIFPPTFAPPRDSERGGYNIDRFGRQFEANAKWNEKGDRGEYGVRFADANADANVCLINSVGAEANRAEIVFRPDKCSGKYAALVPQVIVEAGDQRINLLDAGHRAGDALIRFTPFGETLWDAFRAYLASGDAEPIAKAAPTSIVFGVWDSRGTQAKLPRVFRSVIRAFNVRPLTRNAQYNRATKYTDNGLIKEELDKGTGENNPLSREGFNDNPAGQTVGGIIVDGEIRREMSINLAAIRRLRVPHAEDAAKNDADRTTALRRYILALSLVAATARTDDRFDLREGCQLRIKPGSKAAWTVVRYDGTDESISDLTEGTAEQYAQKAAEKFGVGASKPVKFDTDAVNKWLALKKDEQDKRRRNAPMTKQFPATDGSSSDTMSEPSSTPAATTRSSRHRK